MARKYEYIGGTIPSEDFSEDTDAENRIYAIGEVVHNRSTIRQKGTDWIRLDDFSQCTTKDSSIEPWQAAGLHAKIISPGASCVTLDPDDIKGYYKIAASGRDTAWNTGDGGKVKFWMYENLAGTVASGDTVVLVRRDFDYMDDLDPTLPRESLYLNRETQYWDFDEIQASGMSTDQWASSLAMGTDVTLSITEKFYGNYSIRMHPQDTNHEPNVGINVKGFGNSDWLPMAKVERQQYVKWYFWFDYESHAHPRMVIVTDLEGQGTGLGDYFVFGVKSSKSDSNYCYAFSDTEVIEDWTVTSAPIKEETWNKVEVISMDGDCSILINNTEIYKFENGASCYSVSLRTRFISAGTDPSFVYYDALKVQTLPNPEPYFITENMDPPHRVGRWESVETGFFSSNLVQNTDYYFTATTLDADKNIVEGLQQADVASQTEMSLVGIDEWVYQNIAMRFDVRWISEANERDPQSEFRMDYWTLKYARAPDAVSLVCELNSGDDPYDDVSPNSQIDTETDALSIWRARYNERTHPVFDILFDWGDGHNTGWQTGEKHSHVYSRACESGYSDFYYPFFIAQDQYGGLSASGCVLDLDVWSATNNLLKVLGDYSAYGQHKRIWAKTGGAQDNFYHIESSSYSAGTTTFALDDHYDLDEDGIVTGDRVDIIDILYGDWDGSNDSYHVISHKVVPTALLRGRPIVDVSGSTVVFDGSESFTPNDEEAITNYYFDSDDSELSSGTQSSYPHLYGSAGTYNPTLYVTESGVTGAVKNSSAVSLTITIQTAEDAGTPAMADVYDLRANLHNQPSEFTKSHESIFQDSEALAGGYPTFIDTEKKGQDVVMKGIAKPLKHYAGATTIQKDAGELDILTLGTLWKNKTIFKYKYRETRLSGASDEKWFVGRIEDFTWSESGGRPHHYEWTAACHYVHGIAESDQEI